MAIVASVAERAAQGATLLDIKRPGWAKEIDLARLNISGQFTCALAQLYDGYYLGAAEVLKADDDALVRHGFYLNLSDPSSASIEYAALTDAWKGEVERRLAA